MGDEARIKLDGVDAVFPAKISFIATEAQFTPKNVETANERAKLMFKVKLRIPKKQRCNTKACSKAAWWATAMCAPTGSRLGRRIWR